MVAFNLLCDYLNLVKGCVRNILIQNNMWKSIKKICLFIELLKECYYLCCYSSPVYLK